ncbi:hypothetical protein [Flaviaesturariibacter terrae]
MRIPFLLVLCFFLYGSAAAQKAPMYRNAIGGRFEFGYDSWIGPSWKHLYTRHHATELAVLFGNLTTVLDAEYHYNGDFPGRTSLQWVAGISGALALYKYYNNANDFFLRPVLGIDVRFKGTPLNVGVDWRPMFRLTGRSSNTATRFSIPIRLAF